MSLTIPSLTDEQKQELDSIMENEQLLECMEANMPNQGEVEADDVILARQAQAVEAFSTNPAVFWSLK